MSNTDGYTVDQDKVRDGWGNEVALRKYVRDACSLDGARVSGPPMAMVASVALEELLNYLGQVVGQLGGLLSDTNDDVRASMATYADLDQGGKTGLEGISAQLHTPAGANPHDFLASHTAQMSRNVAEIGVSEHFDPSTVRLMSGDVLTTGSGRLLVVGQDGQFYENGRPAATPTGEEVRMYRRPMADRSGPNMGGVA